MPILGVRGLCAGLFAGVGRWPVTLNSLVQPSALPCFKSLAACKITTTTSFQRTCFGIHHALISNPGRHQLLLVVWYRETGDDPLYTTYPTGPRRVLSFRRLFWVFR
ncbi:Uncharacterised protein [Serratia plymuthica]|nr:Uncharacterised protein [Serratia plymuthica]